MPRPAIATTETSSDQRVERSDQSFVHSERTTRACVTPTLASGQSCSGAHRAAPTDVSSAVGAAWYSTESMRQAHERLLQRCLLGGELVQHDAVARRRARRPPRHEMPWSVTAEASPSGRP